MKINKIPVEGWNKFKRKKKTKNYYYDNYDILQESKYQKLNKI